MSGLLINGLGVEGFAVFREALKWHGHGSLNVIIGENDTGKTHLLKLLYSVTRAIEEYFKKVQGPEPLDLSSLLAAKLRWVFLPHNLELGRLVSRGGEAKLKIALGINPSASVKFEFGRSTTSRILQCHSDGLSVMKSLRCNYLLPQRNSLNL